MIELSKRWLEKHRVKNVKKIAKGFFSGDVYDKRVLIIYSNSNQELLENEVKSVVYQGFDLTVYVVNFKIDDYMFEYITERAWFVIAVEGPTVTVLFQNEIYLNN